MTPIVIARPADAFLMMVMLAGPLLGVAWSSGLLVSIFQAVTQINEMTLTFVPK